MNVLSFTEYVNENANEFINESAKNTIIFTTDDLIKYNVWTPNDDLTKNDCQTLCREYFKRSMAFNADCEALGVHVTCTNLQTRIKFILSTNNATDKNIINVIKFLSEIFVNAVYSTCGDDNDIKNMLKNI